MSECSNERFYPKLEEETHDAQQAVRLAFDYIYTLRDQLCHHLNPDTTGATSPSTTSGAGPFIRTFLVRDTKVGDDVGDNITSFGATINQASVIRRITGTLRVAITADLQVKFRVKYPNGDFHTIGTFTVPSTTPIKKAVIFQTFTWDTLPDLGVIIPDIVASDGSKDNNGVAAFTIEWAGRGSGLPTVTGWTAVGEWSAGTTYNKGDVVGRTGSSYLSLQDNNTANTPETSPTWWFLLVKKGTDGANGAPGAAGVGVPAGGTAGQLLKKNTATDYDTGWTNPPAAIPLTTKGDLVAYDVAATRLPVGTDAQVLMADSTQATGIKWGTPATQVTDLLASASGDLILSGNQTIVVRRVA